MILSFNNNKLSINLKANSMSLIKFNRTNFPWVPDKISTWFDTNDLYFDDFYLREKQLPAMNVKELEDKFEIELAIPGFSKHSIEVSIDADMLYVKANQSSEINNNDENYTKQEFSYNSFHRQVQLPSSVDSNQEVKAQYKKGILTLSLLKKKEEKSLTRRKIEIA